MNSSFAYRKFEEAYRRLETLSRMLASDKITETLDGIAVAQVRGNKPNLGVVADALAEVFAADLQKAAHQAIFKAQDEVKAAAAVLHEAIDSDLKINMMRD